MEKSVPERQKTFTEERNWELAKAKKALKKMKSIERKSNLYSYRFSNGTVICAKTQERLQEMKTYILKQNPTWK